MTERRRDRLLRRWPWLALLALSLALHLVGLGERTFHHDESIHAKLSWDLATSGAYRYDPTYHGPVLYYVTACFLAVRDTDYTARLPIALIAVGMLWVAWRLRRPFGERAAWTAGLLFTVSPTFLFFGRFLREDLIEVVTASLAVLGWYAAVHGRRSGWVALGVWAALAFATKENCYVTSALIAVTAAVMAWRHGAHSVAPRVASWSPERGAWGRAVGPLAVLAVGLRDGLTERGRFAVEWLWRRWTGVVTAVSCFVLVVIPLYTVGFARPQDWVFPLPAIAYWWNQHKIQRVGGPWWFHLPRLAQYELLILLAAVVWVVRRRKRLHPVEEALFVFGLSSIAMYCYLGEKVPWLAVHQVWPFVPLAAAQLARSLGRRGRWWSRGLAVAGILATAVSAFVACFVLDEITPRQQRVESVHFVQTCPEVGSLVKEGLALSAAGERPTAAVSGEAVWPLSWYWRHVYVSWAKPTASERPPLVVCDPEAEADATVALGSGYSRERIPLRAWWLMERFEFQKGEGRLDRLLGYQVADVVRYLFTRVSWSGIGSTDVIVLRRLSEQPPLAEEAAPPEALRRSLGARSAKVLGRGFLAEPRGVALAAGRLAVADARLSRVVVMATDGSAQEMPLARFLQQPEAVAWGPDGTLFIADTWSHRVVTVAASGTAQLPTPKGGWYGPRAVAVSPRGAVAVADTGNRRVVLFSPSLEIAAILTAAGSGGLDEPGGLTWLDDRSLLVCDTGHHRLLVLSTDDSVAEEVPLPDAWPELYARPQVAALGPKLWLVSDTPAAALWLVRDGVVKRLPLERDGVTPTGLSWDAAEKALAVGDLRGRVWLLEVGDG